MSHPSHRSLGTILLLSLSGAVFLLGLPKPGRAQVGPALLGAAGGLLVGGYTTVTIYVTKARFGRYLFSTDELLSLRPETVPVLVGPVVGAWLGAESSTALARSAGWGALGLAGGAALGTLAGRLLSDTDEAPWAGAVIGGGVGLLTGTILGAIDGLGDDRGGGAPVSLTFSLPVGGV